MQLLTRRAVVKGGLGAAVATLPLAHVESALALASRATGAGLPLTRSTFTPLLGTRLEMLDGTTSVMARLVAIGDLRPARMPNDEQCFSLSFQAARKAGAEQKIYRFRSTKLGTVSLFAVPTATGIYEVVVNNAF